MKANRLGDLTLLAVALLAGASACAVPRDGSEGFPDTATRQRSAVRVAEIAATPPEVLFTQISRLAVDSRGTVFIADHFGGRVIVVSPDGQLTGTLGRRGSGPGEFQSVQSIQTLPGDSLLVYDPSLGRVSVFAPDSSRVAYTQMLSTGGIPWQVQRTRNNDGYLVRYRRIFAFGTGGSEDPRMDRIAVLDLDGSPRRDLLTFPSRSSLVVEQSIALHPFGAEGLTALDSQDRLHLVWSDTLAVSRIELDGTPREALRWDYTPPRVTPADVERALADLGNWRARFAQVLADSTPARWPAVRDMRIDEEDRIWLALSGSIADPTEWVAFDGDGAYLGSVIVPAGSDVLGIRDGHFYAERMQDDAPRLVVYRMTRPLR